jgi:hypothetical protein
MTFVWVRFRPGFTIGGGFPAEQFLLWRYSILLCGGFNESEFKRFVEHGCLSSLSKCAGHNETTTDQHPHGALRELKTDGAKKQFPEVL